MRIQSLLIVLIDRILSPCAYQNPGLMVKVSADGHHVFFRTFSVSRIWIITVEFSFGSDSDVN